MNRVLTAALACVASLWCIAAGPTAVARAVNQAQDYVVKPGDTLLAIALRFGVSVTTLQATNNIANPDQLKIGQSLLIPGAGADSGKSGPSTTHVVQAGDTLGGIGLKYNVGLQELMRENNLSESSLLQIGQQIAVPATGTTNAQAAAPAAPVAPEASSIELIPLVPLVPLVPIATTASPPAGSDAASAQPQQTQAPIPIAAADGDLERMRAEMLEWYNKVRAENGLPALAYSGTLQQAAQGHADDCAARGKGSHVGSDGSKSSERIARVGFTGRITGENWAWARTVAKAFDMWYYREIPDGPHLKNILGPRYTEVGFGIAASKGGFYFIANFGAQ